MARIRAVVTLPWTSNLPTDVSVNTFHFATASSPASAPEMAEIATNLTSFYNSDFGAAGDPISEYLSPLISRTADVCTIEQFDLDDPEPRQPVDTTTFGLGAAGGGNTMPGEVALCASFEAAPISGISQARRRGRVYIGPLDTVASNQTTGRPATSFRVALADAMEGIFGLQAGSGVVWSVYSRAGDALAAVTGGWVDDEWDTMRSRGRIATTRTLWP